MAQNSDNQNASQDGYETDMQREQHMGVNFNLDERRQNLQTTAAMRDGDAQDFEETSKAVNLTTKDLDPQGAAQMAASYVNSAVDDASDVLDAESLTPDDILKVASQNPTALTLIQNIQGSFGDRIRDMAGLSVAGLTEQRLQKLLGAATSVRDDLHPEHPGRALVDDLISKLKEARQMNSAQTATISKQGIEQQTQTMTTTKIHLDGGNNAKPGLTAHQSATQTVTPGTPQAVIASTMSKAVDLLATDSLQGSSRPEIAGQLTEVKDLMTSTLSQLVHHGRLNPSETVVAKMFIDYDSEKAREADPLAPSDGRNNFVESSQAVLARLTPPAPLQPQPIPQPTAPQIQGPSAQA